jgi:hypothetical protein
MHLRDHPLLSYQGVPSWPPVWTRVGCEDLKTLRGEIGILKSIVARDLGRSTRCFLIIEYNGELYLGDLLISDPVACDYISQMIACCIGLGISHIGDLDL